MCHSQSLIEVTPPPPEPTIYVAGVGDMSKSVVMGLNNRLNHYKETFVICSEHPLWKEDDCIITFLCRLYIEHNMTPRAIGDMVGKTKFWFLSVLVRIGVKRKPCGGAQNRLLTEDQVRYIRSDHGRKNIELAHMYGVERHVISACKHRHTYANII